MAEFERATIRDEVVRKKVKCTSTLPEPLEKRWLASPANLPNKIHKENSDDRHRHLVDKEMR